MDAVLYARLSQEDDDPTLELTGTQRQLHDLRRHAEANGYRIVAEYEDADASAYDTRKRRKAFEAMLADLASEASTVGAVLCWKLDRLTRRDREAADLIDLAISRNIAIVSLHDPVDLTSPTGRFMFRTMVNMGLAEVETTSLRQRAKARAIAETGRAVGGGIRPFGLRRVRDEQGQLVKPPRYEVVPAEAALVCEAADRILAGDALWAIVRDWERRDVRTPGCKGAPQGRRWEVSSLQRMLTAPRIVGDREHLGAITGTGQIPAMLDRPTWEKLRAALSVRRGQPGRRTRAHYLTGLLVCGRCGALLQPASLAGKGRFRYSCRRPRGCGRLSVLADHLEPLVAEAIAQRLDSPEFHAALEAASAKDGRAAVDMAQLRADEQALEDLNRARYVERLIADAEYRPVRAELVARIDGARQRLAASLQRSPVAAVAARDIRAEWDQLDATRKHEVAAALLERITLLPSPSGGRTFDPSRVAEPVWRV